MKVGQSARRLLASGGLLLAAIVLLAAGLIHLRHSAPTAVVAALGVPVAVLPAGPTGIPEPGAGYFALTAAPGKTVRLHALILNRTRARPLLAVAPVDAYRTRSGLAYRLPEDARRGVGAWLSVPGGTFRLRPTGRSLLTFTVHVPGAITAGTYAGALSIALPAGATMVHAPTPSVRVKLRLAVAVIVRVPPGSGA